VAVALDSDAVIGFLDSGDALHVAADSAIRELLHSDKLVVSVVTYAEVLTGARLGHHDEDVVAGFFAELISEVLAVDVAVADMAADLRAQQRSLRMPDALILATAEVNPEVETIVSGDANTAKVAGLGCKVHLLR
jgi:predicted nucleic acid-binding protein